MSEKSYNENAYNEFAYCYDLFMDNIPYDMWAEYLYGLFQEYGITGGTLLELGCGTGTMTERMISKGYDSIIGLDCSEDMLMVAGDKNIPGCTAGTAGHERTGSAISGGCGLLRV